MKTNLAACFLCLAVCVAMGQNPSTTTSRDEQGLLAALENTWNQAQLHHDSKALDALIADTFISTDNDGTVMNKAQFLEDNKDPSYAPTLMANTDVRISMYDKAAVVVGTYHAKGLNKGKPFDSSGRFTDMWVYLSGRWMCVATHTSPLKRRRNPD